MPLVSLLPHGNYNIYNIFVLFYKSVLNFHLFMVDWLVITGGGGVGIIFRFAWVFCSIIFILLRSDANIWIYHSSASKKTVRLAMH